MSGTFAFATLSFCCDVTSDVDEDSSFLPVAAPIGIEISSDTEGNNRILVRGHSIYGSSIIQRQMKGPKYSAASLVSEYLNRTSSAG